MIIHSVYPSHKKHEPSYTHSFPSSSSSYIVLLPSPLHHIPQRGNSREGGKLCPIVCASLPPPPPPSTTATTTPFLIHHYSSPYEVWILTPLPFAIITPTTTITTRHDYYSMKLVVVAAGGSRACIENIYVLLTTRPPYPLLSYYYL